MGGSRPGSPLAPVDTARGVGRGGFLPVGGVGVGMNRIRVVGLALSAGGLVGYVLGVLAPYPGRGFTLTAVMVGITLVAIGGDAG